MVKLPGESTKIYQAIRDNIKPILTGTMLVIDPSIGSMSSMPGWALSQAGVLVYSGTLKIDPTMENWEKLRELHRLLRNMSLDFQPDICCFEQVPVSAHGGRSQVSHATLLMAVGVTMCAVQADRFIGLAPNMWKPKVRSTYVKSDENDAKEMAWIAIEIAKEILRTDPPRRYRSL